MPLGQERWHVTVAQAPAWAIGFILGVLGGERGWFQPLPPDLARLVRRVAWAAAVASAAVVAIVATTTDVEVLFGHGSWHSLVFAVLEGVVMVTMSLWLVDVFRRRANHRGTLARRLSRAAYATLLVHQIVLVGVVVGSRQMPAPPELKYLTVAVLGVTVSFGLASALVRMPAVSRVI